MNEVKQARSAPRRPNKKELRDILLKKLDDWIKAGDTPEEAVGKLSVRQYDFLIDQNVDLDNLLLTTEQQSAIKQMRSAGRTVKPGGYNKKYPEPKQNLFMGIVEHITAQGAEIIPKEKENFRDLDFILNGTHYKIVLSNPRK